MFKRITFAAIAAFILMLSLPTGQAHAEMPQTDVELVTQMGKVENDKIIQALAVYYDLHVSELHVQYMDERRTGAGFAVQRARAAGKSAQDIAMLEQKAEAVGKERAAQVQKNQNLRIKLGELTGIDFSDSLVMAPAAPMDLKTPPTSAPTEALGKMQTAAWKVLQEAHRKWQEERLILLDAQQRYDETRDVPIGNHLRAMTAAETALAQAVGDCRLVEAKIAAASGTSIAQVLAAL